MRTIPNLITICRIALTPFIVIAILGGNCRRALILAAVAGVSDGIDGFLARQFHWKSRAGAYLDPIADKLLLTAVYVSFGYSGMAPFWLVALVIGRDFPPSAAGKLSTAIQIFTALCILSVCAFGVTENQRNLEILAWTTAAVTAWSGVDYALRGARMLIMRRTFLPADRRSPRG
jgi:cardiolipin synthase